MGNVFFGTKYSTGPRTSWLVKGDFFYKNHVIFYIDWGLGSNFVSFVQLQGYITYNTLGNIFIKCYIVAYLMKQILIFDEGWVVWSKYSPLFFFKFIYLFWERDRESELESVSRGRAERGRDRIPSRLCAVSSESWCGSNSGAMRSWPERRSRVDA